MARQGKMAGSPFHVESKRYISAVERGADSEIYVPEVPTCVYYRENNRGCTLWNSGYKTCTAFKCAFYKTNLRKQLSCITCSNASYEQKTPICKLGDCRLASTEATYCHYYSENSNGRDRKPLISGYTEKRFTPKNIRKIKYYGIGHPYFDNKWYVAGALQNISETEFKTLIGCLDGYIVHDVKRATVYLTTTKRMPPSYSQVQELIKTGHDILILSESEFLREIKKILNLPKKKKTFTHSGPSNPSAKQKTGSKVTELKKVARIIDVYGPLAGRYLVIPYSGSIRKYTEKEVVTASIPITVYGNEKLIPVALVPDNNELYITEANYIKYEKALRSKKWFEFKLPRDYNA